MKIVWNEEGDRIIEYGERSRGEKTCRLAKSAVVREVRLKRKKNTRRSIKGRQKRRSESTSYGKPPVKR
jgi:hypothetical protein